VAVDDVGGPKVAADGLLVSRSHCRVLFVLMVNDSEYSRSAGANPILPPSCICFVSLGAAVALNPPNLEAEPLVNGGSSLPGSASSCARISAPLFLEKNLLMGGGKEKKEKEKKSCPKGPDRFSPPHPQARGPN
jgi:hypothetical protein